MPATTTAPATWPSPIMTAIGPGQVAAMLQPAPKSTLPMTVLARGRSTIQPIGSLVTSACAPDRRKSRAPIPATSAAHPMKRKTSASRKRSMLRMTAGSVSRAQAKMNPVPTPKNNPTILDLTASSLQQLVEVGEQYGGGHEGRGRGEARRRAQRRPGHAVPAGAPTRGARPEAHQRAAEQQQGNLRAQNGRQGLSRGPILEREVEASEGGGE